MRIGICDDETFILGKLKRIMEECLEELKVKGEIVTFNSGEELLHENPELDVLFLDIVMPGIDGIETGKKLREEGKNYKIVIATSMVERFKEVFKIDTFRFITKPFLREEVREVMEDVLDTKVGMKPISLYKERIEYIFSQKDIKYVTAWDSSVECILQEGVFRKETSLGGMEKILDTEIFFRIHRKYIVNMKWIEKYENGTIVINGKEKKISERRKKEFEKKYIEYIQRK